jgi:hypothetical protein
MQFSYKLCNFIFSTCQQQSLKDVTCLRCAIQVIPNYVTCNDILIVQVKQNGLFNETTKEIKMTNFYKETDVIALIEAVRTKANELESGFVADNLRVIGFKEYEARILTEAVGDEYNGTAYASLASYVAYEMDAVNGGDWQYGLDDVLRMIDEEVTSTNSTNLQAA